MDIIQVLQDLGLKDKEPDIFLMLLKTQGVQPASVIAKKVNMNRTTVYKSLLKLAKMGLVVKTMKRGVTAFYVENPEDCLENLLANQREKLDRVNERLSRILAEIKSFQTHQLTIPHMRVYDGLSGVIRAYEDTIAQENTIRSFENIEKMPPVIKEYMENTFVPHRMDRGNFAHVLAPESKANIEARKDDKKFLREARFAPKNQLPLETGINIYGNKISFFSYDPDDMFGVILESEAFANSLRAVFDFCWEHSK